MPRPLEARDDGGDTRTLLILLMAALALYVVLAWFRRGCAEHTAAAASAVANPRLILAHSRGQCIAATSSRLQQRSSLPA